MSKITNDGLPRSGTVLPSWVTWPSRFRSPSTRTRIATVGGKGLTYTRPIWFLIVFYTSVNETVFCLISFRCPSAHCVKDFQSIMLVVYLFLIQIKLT